MSLREAIAEKHDKAENHRFVKLLFSGQMPKEVYADYLFNQFLAYSKLEELADKHGLLNGVEQVKRVAAMEADIAELGCDGFLCPSTASYIDYLNTVPAEKLMAHVYVRHFGDMYGGQMLKRVTPGSGRMYEFENRAELIAKLRAKLTDDLAEEANRVFDFAIGLFDELAYAHNISAA